MPFLLSDAAMTAAMNAIFTLPDSGTIKFFGGASMPATCELGDAGTVLMTITLPATAFQTPTDGGTYFESALVASQSGTGAAEALTGTEVTYVRMYTSGGACVLQDDDIGTSGTRVVLSDTSIAEGQVYDVTSWYYRLPTGIVSP